MKIFKLLLVLSVVITISFFSWSYYASRQLHEKHERATLVFEECLNKNQIFGLGRFYVYE